MIQRIQSIFLLIVAALMVTLIFMPLASFNTVNLAAQSIALEASLTMPIAALILDYLAMKKIKQDDDLVKSMDRIR